MSMKRSDAWYSEHAARLRARNVKGPQWDDNVAPVSLRMIDDDLTPREKRERAMHTFMVRIGQHGRATQRCEHTAPLFPLALILDADGTLRDEAKPLVELVAA